MNARLEGPRPRSRECPPTGQRLKPRLKACRHETDLRRLGNGASSCHVCPLLLDCSHVVPRSFFRRNPGYSGIRTSPRRGCVLRVVNVPPCSVLCRNGGEGIVQS
jgi:hypothetical protein